MLRLNPDTGKLGMSYFQFKSKDLSKLGQLILKVRHYTRLYFSCLCFCLLLAFIGHFCLMRFLEYTLLNRLQSY